MEKNEYDACYDIFFFVWKFPSEILLTFINLETSIKMKINIQSLFILLSDGTSPKSAKG